MWHTHCCSSACCVLHFRYRSCWHAPSTPARQQAPQHGLLMNHFLGSAPWNILLLLRCCCWFLTHLGSVRFLSCHCLFNFVWAGYPSVFCHCPAVNEMPAAIAAVKHLAKRNGRLGQKNRGVPALSLCLCPWQQKKLNCQHWNSIVSLLRTPHSKIDKTTARQSDSQRTIQKTRGSSSGSSIKAGQILSIFTMVIATIYWGIDFAFAQPTRLGSQQFIKKRVPEP